MNIPRNKYNLITGALALLLLVATIAAVQMKEKYDENDVFVRNLKLFTGSRQFFIKGVNYSPQPLGRANEAGLCSKKINHEGVYYDACIFEDYFDGVNSDNGGSPHPSGPWWREVWRRDFPLMRDMGANAMRVYHMSPFTKELIEKYPTIYSKYVPYKQYAPEHRTFMDTAAEYGLKVIVPIVSEESILTLYSEDDLNRFVEARVDEIGNHSALLMWVVGNELGLYSKPDLRALVNKMIIKVREYTLERWNRIIPVTTCEVDLPQSYNMLTDEIDVDIFMTNAGYRDVFINTLWEPDTNNNFVGWEAKSKEFGLPVLVGEFGMHDQDSQTAGRPDWINQQYRPMVQYMTKGSIGGLFFEFNEETLKPPNQQQMGLVRFAPNSEKQGEDSTMVGVFVPDRAYKKDVVFEAIAQGLADSSYKEWNFKNSEYDLVGVKQTGLDLTQITPRPFGHNFPGSGEDGVTPEVSLSPLPSPSYPPSPSYSSSPVPKPSPSESIVKPEPTPSKSKSTPGTQESSILPRESTGSHSHNDSSSFYYKAALYTALFVGSVVSLLHIWH